MSVEFLGNPLTLPYDIPGGQARLYQRGATITGARGEAVVTFQFPMIGRPGIVTGHTSTTPLFELHAVRFALGAWGLDELASLVQIALKGRLALLPTGESVNPIRLTFGGATIVTPGTDIYGLPVTIASLQERQLYDVAILADGNQWIVASHALYHRRSWTDFGIAHVTDIHVARRIDGFREVLVQTGRTVGAKRLYNWNDRFRGFVRYANYLHTIGLLDVVISTGDQYDYIYEDDDDRASGGNAAFMRKLILGQAPGPDFSDVEELRVPIFMIPGNHDYRKHPYKLIFDLHVDTRILGPEIGTDLKRFTNFSSYNLALADAKVLAAKLEGLPDVLLPLGHVANVSPEGAARMVEVDREIEAHREFLSDRTSYVVQLGNHRVVMLDSGPDTGMLTSVWDGLRNLFGNTSEDEDTFVDGSPNSEGVSDSELGMVSEALADMPDEGLFIVGVHAPLVNPIHEEYPYFLRETQRPSQRHEVPAFLARHSDNGVAQPSQAEQLMKARHPTWFAAAGDDAAPAFVKRVNSQDMLDFAVSRGRSDDVIRLLAGVGTHRPADIVLSGHTHYQNEFSVRSMPSGEIAFFMDFYTQNPTNYYPTRFTKEWVQIAGQTPFFPRTDKTYVEVLPEAQPDATPSALREAKLKYDVKVPPYQDPLNSASNSRAWWSAHRPLLVQTGALGPLKVVSSLAGFRILSVRNNVIDKIHFISTARLEANNYRLPWEEAILPDHPGPPAPTWNSVSDGSTTPGGHVMAITIGEDRIAVFAADPAGGIFTTTGNYQDGWQPWTSVADGKSTPGAPLAAVRNGDRVTLFVADPNGGVFATSGNAQHGWGAWKSVSDGATMPGGHVSAVDAGDQIAVFVADPGGGIYATSGTYDDGWRPWKSVSSGNSTPGASIGAVVIGNDTTVFVADSAGGVYATSGNYHEGWRAWKSVSEGGTSPGGHLTGVFTDGDRLTLFVCDVDGSVFTTSGNYHDGWQPWKSVSEGSSSPGGHVTAIPGQPTRITLFVADRNGDIFTTSGSYHGGWAPWTNIAQGASLPGAPLGATINDERVALFLADANGGIYTIMKGFG